MTLFSKLFSTPLVLTVLGMLGAACVVGDEPEADPFDNEAMASDRAASEDKCNPKLLCGDALTCVDGMLYPTTCGPDNCDEPLGPCDVAASACDPELICGDALTCVDGKLYPSTCGPDNCDAPIGDC